MLLCAKSVPCGSLTSKSQLVTSVGPDSALEAEYEAVKGEIKRLRLEAAEVRVREKR